MRRINSSGIFLKAVCESSVAVLEVEFIVDMLLLLLLLLFLPPINFSQNKFNFLVSLRRGAVCESSVSGRWSSVWGRAVGEESVAVLEVEFIVDMLLLLLVFTSY